jgi:hypothetical protein
MADGMRQQRASERSLAGVGAANDPALIHDGTDSIPNQKPHPVSIHASRSPSPRGSQLERISKTHPPRIMTTAIQTLRGDLGSFFFFSGMLACTFLI